MWQPQPSSDAKAESTTDNKAGGLFAPRKVACFEGRIGIEVRRNRFDKPSGSPGIRTPNLRIKSPLLYQVELATPSEVSQSRSGETRSRRPTPIPCGPSAGVAELA